MDVKVKANTNLTEANAGKIADIEEKTAGDLALLPAILKCAELGQVYSTKSKKCSSATSVKCPVLSNLNPLVAADSKLLSASKHLLATENVTQGAIVIDANVCAHNNHFGAFARLAAAALSGISNLAVAVAALTRSRRAPVQQRSVALPVPSVP